MSCPSWPRGSASGSLKLARVRGTAACPVRYLLEDKAGVTPFRSLEDVERKLIAMAQERARRRTVFKGDVMTGSNASAWTVW